MQAMVASAASGRPQQARIVHRALCWCFTRTPDDDDSLGGIFVWWESRRVPYNLMLAVVGIPCFIVFMASILASGQLEPGEDAVEPIALMAAPFLFNIAYTAGWICEMGLRLVSLRGSGPLLMKLGVGVIGMKSLGGGNGKFVKDNVCTAEEALRFALAQPVASIVSGIDSMEVLKKNVATARKNQLLSGEELSALFAKVKPQAGDGRHERFKSTIDFDGPYHQKQHGFATEAK